MNKTVAAALFIGLALISCEPKQAKTQKTNPDFKKEAQQLNALLEQGNVRPQSFEISSTAASEVTGAKGIFIRVDPKDLETENGKPLADKILVELRELTQPSEFVFSDVSSGSFNGKHILSGGTYFVSMTSGGNKLKIKPGRALNVDFRRFSTKRMEFFTGSRDSIQNLVWVPSNQRFKRISADDDPQTEEYYMTMPITRLGWIASAISNRASHNTSTTFAFDIKQPSSYSFGKAFFIVEKNGSVQVMNTTLFFDGKDNMMFEQVPLEGFGLFVVTAVKSGKLYAWAERLDLEKLEMPMVELSPTTPSALYDQIRKLK
ncbi:hypothetical protein [Flavobacterium selenitireducens]|uniref:hypothetical protein n=1 Tax=Flavobacterium selenitireducens TaxID=2722704 RepID=UPI00168C028C|nr:hypothetical protein [Flavobacterium selenitireducens]MBD3583763.1 hypothetical protein [Flavobacterium selenitireducens]